MSKVMCRYETLDYLKEEYKKGTRSVISRYNDGEYLLMNNTDRVIANSTSGILSDLLKKAIKIKGQFICVNYLKTHNIEKKDRWYEAQKYLIDQSKNELYGCSNYNVQDFCEESELISKYFIGNVLIVTGLDKETLDFFKDLQPIVSVYKTPMSNAVSEYENIKKNLENICNNYDTIIFSCGPLAKVLVADLIDKCKTNLIDFGSVLNAILDLTSMWTMSWTKDIDLQQKRNNFINKIKEFK
jgi:hypothetical protein